jgi:hypothetical protein
MATATATSLIGGGRRNAWLAVAASDTDEVVVAAVTGKKIRVTAALLNHGDTTASAITFNSKGAGAGTAISPPLKGPANGGFVVPDNPKGWFETVSGEALTVSSGAGSDTSIIVTYERVK